MSTGPDYLYRWLFCIVMLFNAGFASAQQNNDACLLSEISTDFKQYLKTITRDQVVRIQSQLNVIGYGPIEADGVLGKNSRLALQRFCQAKQVGDAPDGIAKTLVDLLEQSAATSVTKTEAETPVVAPVAEVKAEAVTPIVAPEAEVKAEAVIPVAVHAAEASAASVFYRWSTPEVEEVDDEASEMPVTDEQTEPDTAIPDEVIEQLAVIESVAYPNQKLFEKALDALFADSELDYEPYQNQIIEQARVGPVEEFNKIQVSGDGCGCARDDASVVYGFYPYWLAADVVQSVDFSLFDRIGFYALWLNPQGEIQNPLQWSDDGNAAGFINTAHKHRVDVDVSIYATGWQTWSDKVLQSAVGSTAQAVKQKFSNRGSSQLAEALPMFEDSSSVQGDGVTLVFEDYSAATETSHKINTFVNKLSEKLTTAKHVFKINIMLDMNLDALNSETAFSDLKSILLASDDGPAKVENVFVFLPAPTTDSKKILRRMIEDQFRGADRKQVLRKIVPLISAAGHDKDPRGAYSQFTDDLIYFQNNFAGVGLWPLPLNTDPGVETVKAKIIELYPTSSGSNHIGDLVDAYMPTLCQFACPNRWYFRLGFDLLAGLILLYAALAIWIYRLRGIYKQYFGYFLAFGFVTLLVFLISLVCDPYWKEKADVVAGLVILIAAGIPLWRYVGKANQPPLP